MLEEELWEWAVQARRWTIGAGEVTIITIITRVTTSPPLITVQVFHYFMVKAARIPLLTSISWGAAFLLYYGLLLCCSQLYGLTLALSAALLLPGDATLFGTRRDIFLPQLTFLGFYTRKGGYINYN